METTPWLRLPASAAGLCGILVLGCAAPPPPAPVAAPAQQAPLERVCQEALPLPARTLGELARQVHALSPLAAWTSEPCDARTTWPISFAEAGAGRPPIGVALLRMEGDALLTFDPRDRDTPSVKLCMELRVQIDPRHRLWAIALWPSDDEGAFDAAKLESSRAELAFLELRSRTPSACALGRKEEAGAVGEEELRRALRCARPNFVTPIPDDPGCAAPGAVAPADPAAATPIAGSPSVAPGIAAGGAPSAAAEIARGFGRAHRHVFDGRSSVRDPDLVLLAPERCAYEAPPATHDACVSVYRSAGNAAELWYGRSDVTRTGSGGVKNYVDSYLTLQLLRRLEAERRKQNPKPAPAPSAPPPKK